MEIVFLYLHIARVVLGEIIVAVGIWAMPQDSCEQNKMRAVVRDYKDWKDL